MISELARQASWPDKRAGYFFALYTFFSQLIHYNTKNQLKSITTIYISHFFIISINIHVVAGFIAVVIMSHCRPILLSTIIIYIHFFYNSIFIATISKHSIAFYRSNISLFEFNFLF